MPGAGGTEDSSQMLEVGLGSQQGLGWCAPSHLQGSGGDPQCAPGWCLLNAGRNSHLVDTELEALFDSFATDFCSPGKCSRAGFVLRKGVKSGKVSYFVMGLELDLAPVQPQLGLEVLHQVFWMLGSCGEKQQHFWW